MYTIRNLKYNDVLTINSLKIEAKKITCIVGESGGGKTTFLRLLSKLVSPTEGTIEYYQQPLETLDSVAYRKEVVMLPQKPFIFPKTIRDNLVKGLNYHQKEINESSLEQALAFVNLAKPLSTDASRLSGGEAQRLAIARIILLDPQVILLDEPSSALDDETEAFVIKAMVNYVKEHQKSLIMITHSKHVAAHYGDTVLTIEKGCLKGSENNE